MTNNLSSDKINERINVINDDIKRVQEQMVSLANRNQMRLQC